MNFTFKNAFAFDIDKYLDQNPMEMTVFEPENYFDDRRIVFFYFALS